MFDIDPRLNLGAQQILNPTRACTIFREAIAFNKTG